jgi:hypothetical protein
MGTIEGSSLEFLVERGALTIEIRQRVSPHRFFSQVKLPAHRAGLPGNEISFFIVPLDPAYKAGLTGH